MVQLEQVAPNWWPSLTDLADELGTDRATLNRSLSHLDRLELIRRVSLAHGGGTWIWWVQRHEWDRPNPKDEPAWVLRDLKAREHTRITVSGRRDWARVRKIPLNTLKSFLSGHQKRLRGKWELVSTPMDRECEDV